MIMKTLKLAVGIIIASFAAVSCEQNRPEPVVEKYYTHFFRGEYAEIKDYVLEEHRGFYDDLQKLFAGDNTEDAVKVTNIKCEIDGDTAAVCTCNVKIAEEESIEQTIQLKKVKNVWFINKKNVIYSADYEDDADEIDLFPSAEKEE